ncbi:MAG: signal peptidase I [Nitriliruptor sp.]
MRRYLVPLIVVIAWFLTLAPTAIGGPAAYIIVDGTSMEPTYQDGDFVLTRRTSTYEAGDVVAFEAPDSMNSGFRVIHRIVEVTPKGLVTKGDNRGELDPWSVQDHDVTGEAILRVPHAGDALRWVRARPAILGLVAGGLAYILLVPTGREGEEEEEDIDTLNAQDEQVRS